MASDRKTREQPVDTADCSLTQLCDLVMSYSVAYEDVSEQIEDRSFHECDIAGIEPVISCIENVAHFFEEMQNKNEENTADLVAIYILIGEIYQYHDLFAESVSWFNKSVAANDRCSPAFHSLAVSYIRLDDIHHAIRCLEQELRLAPGNYYSYLMLADLYEKTAEPLQVEAVLNRLLDRDPDNLQALHRLIVHYRLLQPEVDTELLRRRLITIAHDFNRAEMIIWVYHMCGENRAADALNYLTKREIISPDMTIINLLKAHVFGELHQYSKKRAELTKFKQKNNGRESFMHNKLKDFEDVFGQRAMARLVQRLTISRPHGTSR